MPLTAIVVGAGIGGLATAIALRQANFSVIILEKQARVREAGQALGIPANASRILMSFGLDLQKTRPVPWTGVDLVKADVNPLQRLLQQTNPKDDTAPSFFVHRVDYHEALMQFAVSPEGKGQAVEIRYSSTVRSYSPSEGQVLLESGEVLKAGLVVAADGVSSTAHKYVVGEEVIPSLGETDLAIVRFTVPTQTILDNPGTRPSLEISDSDRATMYIGSDPNGARLFRYPCRRGELQNFGIYTTIDKAEGSPTLQMEAGKQDIALELLQGMDKSVALIPSLVEASDMFLWKPYDRRPLPQLKKGSLVLIGDACHPMRPNLGQGAAQAIEDAGVLGIVLQSLTDPAQIPARLRIWEAQRAYRVGSAQLLSRATQGRTPWWPEADQEAAEAFMGKDNIPKTVEELASYFIRGDQLSVAREAMAAIT